MLVTECVLRVGIQWTVEELQIVFRALYKAAADFLRDKHIPGCIIVLLQVGTVLKTMRWVWVECYIVDVATKIASFGSAPA